MVGASRGRCTFPVAVDPVKEILATRGSVQRTCPTDGVLSLEQGTTLKTPAGIPACSASWERHRNTVSDVTVRSVLHLWLTVPVPTSARARADSGVSSAGFTTTVQPTARAAPTFLVIIALGKFHWKQRNHVRLFMKTPSRSRLALCHWLLTGVMMEATPTGCLRRRSFLSLAGDGTMSP